MTQADSTAIDALRTHIDQIDDQLHDLLMGRFALVERIGALKGDGTLALRPGREAQILRRLMGRHRSALPKATVARIWREILGSFTSAQSPLLIAVAQGDHSAGLMELAREHFGAVPPVRPVPTAGQVVKLVAEGQAPVGVVPLPGVGGHAGTDSWWAAMTSETAPRVVTRLPFFAYDRAEPVDGLVIAMRPHDNTGDDRTFLILESTQSLSRDRVRELVLKAEFAATDLLASTRLGNTQLHLVEVEGWIDPADIRLRSIVRDAVSHATIAGGYPVPLI